MAGNITITDKVVASIVRVAAAETEGVYVLGEASLAGRLADALEDEEERTKGVRVEVGQDGVSVYLTLSVVYGYRIPEVADRVRQNVAQALRRRCGLGQPCQWLALKGSVQSWLTAILNPVIFGERHLDIIWRRIMQLKKEYTGL